jgi:DNA-binding transcriptional LysR family regulator
MDTEKLRLLLLVIEYQSITAAAQKSGYTPSGISRMIVSLENVYGFPLLIRKHEGVEPTEACRSLLPEIREILYHEELLSQRAGEIRGISVGTVTIGSAYSSSFPALKKIITGFNKKYPGITFHVTSGFSTDLCAELSERMLDIAIVGKREGKWNWSSIGKSRMMAWVPAGSKYASLEKFPLEIVREEPYIEIYSGIDTDNKRILAKNRITPNIRMYAKDSYTAFAMVEAGLGIALNEEENCLFKSKKVKIIPVTPVQNVEIGIAAAADLSPAARRFLFDLEGKKDTVLSGSNS